MGKVIRFPGVGDIRGAIGYHGRGIHRCGGEVTPRGLNVISLVASANCGGDDPVVFEMSTDVGVTFSKDTTLIKAITVYKTKKKIKYLANLNWGQI